VSARPRYAPRDRPRGLLAEALREGLPGLSASLAREGRTLPRFVRRELFKIGGCGDLRRGFSRHACTECGAELLVPFSCKSRGFCASCMGRRMRLVSDHLVTSVIPCVPVRQWVLTLPKPLRFRLAWDHTFLLDVHRAFTRGVLELYTHVGEARGLTRPRGAAATAVQRFGSGLELNVHFHTLAPDGCFFEKPDGSVSFRALGKLHPSEVRWALERAMQRIEEACARHGYRLTGLVTAERTEPVVEDAEPGLAQLQLAALTGARGVGEHAEVRLRRLVTAPPRNPDDEPSHASELKARIHGFDLHAGVRVGAFERERLEGLCRYLLRPPLSEDRLTKVSGTYLLRLKTPWRDGTTHLVLSPEELALRLVALIPRPGKNQLLYAGAFSPNARMRDAVVALNRSAPAEAERRRRLAARQRRNRRGSPENPTFAQLMRRSFGIEVTECATCGGKLELLALVESPAEARAHLESRGLLRALDALLAPPRGRGPPSEDAGDRRIELDEEALEHRLLEAVGIDPWERGFTSEPRHHERRPKPSIAHPQGDSYVDLHFDFGA
jgi:hypothetical protein